MAKSILNKQGRVAAHIVSQGPLWGFLRHLPVAINAQKRPLVMFADTTVFTQNKTLIFSYFVYLLRN